MFIRCFIDSKLGIELLLKLNSFSLERQEISSGKLFSLQEFNHISSRFDNTFITLKSTKSGLSIKLRDFRFFNSNSPFGMEVNSQSRKLISSR